MKKPCVFIGLTIVAAIAVTAARSEAYSDAELLQQGQSAYDKTKCVAAARFLFAYLVKNPATQNRSSIEKAIDWCERNTTTYAGASGKADGAGGGPVRPALDFGQHAGAAAGRDKRCDVYARLATAQNEANLANGCNFGGSRWSSIYDHHYEWCRTVPSQETRSETQARQQMLDQCAP